MAAVVCASVGIAYPANKSATVFAERLQYWTVQCANVVSMCIVLLQSGIMSQLRWPVFLMVVMRRRQSPSMSSGYDAK